MPCTEDSLRADWEKDQLISRGSHSDVFKIIHKENKEQPRAAKYIRLPTQLGEESQRTAHEKILELLETERQLCNMQHKNIVRFLDMSLLKMEPSVVVSMEMIEGETLEVFINREKPLDICIVTELANQICNALRYLHTFEPRAIIHRDINSRTIMVSDGRAIKLIDFGLAVQLVESATDHVTGNPKGDPFFMAPELFLNEENEDTTYSCASDIWAFGCVIFQMVSGNRPHSDCKNMLALVRRVKNKGAPALPDSSSDTLKDFYAICTAKEKCNRKPAADLLKHPFLCGSSPAIAGQAESDAEAENQGEDASRFADASNIGPDKWSDQQLSGLCNSLENFHTRSSAGAQIEDALGVAGSGAELRDADSDDEDEEADDYEDVQRPVLGFGDGFELDISAQEYLRGVQAEARRCPKVVVAKQPAPPRNQSKEEEVAATKPNATAERMSWPDAKCRGLQVGGLLAASYSGAAADEGGGEAAAKPDWALGPVWQLELVEAFAQLRDRLAETSKAAIKSQIPRLRLPRASDASAWRAFCYGTGGTAAGDWAGQGSGEDEDDEEEGREDEVADAEYDGDGHLPLVSLVTQLPRVSLLALLSHHTAWLTGPNSLPFTDRLGQWLFALLAALKSPLTSEEADLLRRLARACRRERLKLPGGLRHPAAVPMCLIVCLVTRYFGQSDLADD